MSRGYTSAAPCLQLHPLLVEFCYLPRNVHHKLLACPVSSYPLQLAPSAATSVENMACKDEGSFIPPILCPSKMTNTYMCLQRHLDSVATSRSDTRSPASYAYRTSRAFFPTCCVQGMAGGCDQGRV